MIYNAFWALGPNISHYKGGFPNGFLERVKRRFGANGWVHLCSGSIHEGITIDIKPENHPSIVADLDKGIPLPSASCQRILIDPPYSEEHAEKLYALPLINVPRLLKDCARVLSGGGRRRNPRLSGVADRLDYSPT